MLLASFLLQVTGSESMLNPAGAAAHRISTLGWIVFITFMVVSLIMWIIVIWVAVRRRGKLSDHAPYDATGGEPWILAGGILIPIVVLTVMFVLSLDTMSHFPMDPKKDPPPQIIVVGHQWWWEIHYVSGPVDQHFATANELHIPVGENVDIQLRTADVLHSFWIPRLHGKMDLVPNLPNLIRIEASHPGVYRGQCSVFCGDQHAHMAMLVIAQTPADYASWVADQRTDGAQPTSPEAQAGEQVFLSAPCALCHRVRGTAADGVVAPDLTHVGSRLSLASDTLVNNRANLAAWITHAQSLKPGVEMPNLTQFTGLQLRDMVDYLQQLQ
ncbi:MAG: cytochrome c oxidase subunit II [Candidatus Acidiferrales bacterium]